MRKYLLLLAIIFIFKPVYTFGQNGGLGNFAGNDTSISCSNKCFNLKIRVPDIRSTDDYSVAATPYLPYAYNTSVPALKLNCTNQDDKYFDAVDMGFPFCFYGALYNKVVVGTNGLTTFDLSNAKGCNHWHLEYPAQPIPFKGNSIQCPGNCPDLLDLPNHDLDVLYPRASIMGVYNDIDYGTDDPDKKIEFRIEGTAPLRRAIVSFYAVPLFSCDGKVTSEIVMYESTGVIEVYVKDKPVCQPEPDGTIWNSAMAILGIQNWERNKAVAPPGRNLGKWGTTGMNEAWRFTPSGATSIFANKVELLLNGAIVSTGTISALNNGYYNVDFSNVCSTNLVDTFIARAYYTSCDGSSFFIQDSLTVNKVADFTAVATVTNALCTPGSTGTISVKPSGPQYEYSKDSGVSWQPGNSFAVTPSTYTIRVREIMTGCFSKVTTTVSNFTPVLLTASKTDVPCFGQGRGAIVLNPSGSVEPYAFSKDGGVNFQTGNEFKNLIAGTYAITVKDATGCGVDTSITISQPTALTAFATGTASTCNGDDGVITITAQGGTPNYQYSIDNGIRNQNSNTFIVSPGIYKFIQVKDANGCVPVIQPLTIPLIDDMVLSLNPDTTICSGAAVLLQPRTNPQTSIYTWTPATGLNNAGIKNPLASPTVTTTYTLNAKWRACERTADVTISVLNKPVVNAGKDTVICDKATALLRGSATNLSGTVNYKWNPAADVSAVNETDVIVRPASTQTFILTVNDNYGCDFKISDEVLVIVKPPLPAFAGIDTNAIISQPVQLHASGGVDYEWTPAEFLNNPHTQFPVATLSADTKFTVMVKDAEGCSGSDDVFVKVYQGPAYYIPTAFTPNGDGLNDIFIPVAVGIVQTFSFRIFNRYGQPVFETNQFGAGWNGTYKGQKQVAGTYIWMIKGLDRAGKIIEKKGSVMLVR